MQPVSDRQIIYLLFALICLTTFLTDMRMLRQDFGDTLAFPRGVASFCLMITKIAVCYAVVMFLV